MNSKILRLLWIVSAILSTWNPVMAMELARGGKTSYVIVEQAGATGAEHRAVADLAATLKEITGADFKVTGPGSALPEKAIIVGQGPLTRYLLPEVEFETLGEEEIVLRTCGQILVIAGGRPRGTLYAVQWFLQEQCGVRWWTPWASRIPHQDTLKCGPLNLRLRPAFESRDPYWTVAFNRDWAVHNFSNSQSAGLTDADGGCIRYKEFVHTFNVLVPPEQHFATHPEWFSMIKGKRTAENAQLCLMNPLLREFVAGRVRDWLRASPGVRIVSVSQNDCHGFCECPVCAAVDEAEGSHAGSLVSFVNDIAARLEAEFPQVAIDTLAYQYTRKAPKTLRPRPNVIIRLCSIECNFGVPMDDPANASFARDIQDWSRICQRLYIWDYVTDFAHYTQPHPNWFSLGPNVRFFHQHNVRGLFEQGAYQSHGSEMAELRAWLLARLMWDPYQDDRKLIQEFLDNYYGGKSARFIREYMELLKQNMHGHNLTCYSSPEAPFLRYEVLAKAEKLWESAEKAAGKDADLVWRIRQARLPLRYVWLSRWNELKAQCSKSGGTWPWPSIRPVADEWLSVATGEGPKGWSKMTLVNEGGLTPQKWIEQCVAAAEKAEPAK